MTLVVRIVLAGLLLGATLASSAGALAQAGKQPRRPPVVQDYEPDPAIWLLEDADTRIYLFGTFHILPAGFRWRSPRFDGIVADADELVVESTEDADGSSADALLADLRDSLAKRPRVSERLAPANRRKWLALGKSVGLPPEYFDRMPPLLAMFGMALEWLQEESGSTAEYGVETVLEAEFAAAEKPIGSIESSGEVFASLLGIDEGLMIKEIDRALSAWDGDSLATAFLDETGEEIAMEPPLAEEHRWAQGVQIDADGSLFGETPFGRVMNRVLLDDRNRAWAVWLERRLETPGTVLVAVGAGHLEGSGSVQVMLTERGLSANRLN